MDGTTGICGAQLLFGAKVVAIDGGRMPAAKMRCYTQTGDVAMAAWLKPNRFRQSRRRSPLQCRHSDSHAAAAVASMGWARA